MLAACLDDRKAQAFVAAELAVDDRRDVEEHVDDCPACRELLVALVRTEPRPAGWAPGHQVGRYRVGVAIGKGGMGEVYRGDDLELGRTVALKRLRPDLVDAGGRDRLVREARAAAQLQHPNVVAVYELVDDGDAAVLATEWIDGVTLREWLTQRTRGWREVVAVVGAAGRGLAAAHAAGIVHRDFKPDNVLVDREGRARVADFGLAGRFDGPRDEIAARPPTPLLVTVTGSLAGTPAYLAPELIDGGRPDARSDQYAFAITLYEAVHGCHPFAGDTAEAIWTEMAQGRIRRGDRRVPRWLDRCLRRALAVEPERRWPDLAAMLGEIDRRSRRTAVVAVAAAGAVGAAAVAAVWLAAPGSAPACGDDLIDQVWNPGVRATYGTQFAAAAPARAAAALAWTDPVLGHWTESWRLGRRAACAAEPGPRRARTACLDRQLGQLQSQIAVWLGADAQAIDHAAEAVASLPSPDDCAQANATPQPFGPVFDATAQVDALRRAGRIHDALALTPALATAGAAATDPATRASALYAVASVELEAHALADARAHAAAAADAASVSGNDGALASALMLEATVSIELHHPSEALGLCDALGPLVRRGLPRAEKVELIRAHAMVEANRLDDAIASYHRAIELLEADAARDPARRLDLATARGGLGSTLSRSGRYADGAAELRKCLATEEAAYGPDHPEVGRTLHDLAGAEAALGATDDARRDYTRARAIFAAAHGDHSFEVAEIDAMLSDLMIAAGDLDGAYQLAVQARDEAAQSDAPDPVLGSSIESALGLIEQYRDRCGEAIPHFDRALVLARDAGQNGNSLAVTQVNLAICLSDVKRDREARVAAEAALATWDAAGELRPERAQAIAVLADLEFRAGHRKRAIELGREALAMIDGVDGDTFSADSIAAMREYVTDQLRDWSR